MQENKKIFLDDINEVQNILNNLRELIDIKEILRSDIDTIYRLKLVLLQYFKEDLKAVEEWQKSDAYVLPF